MNSAQTVESSVLDESVMQLIVPTGFYTKIRAQLFLGSGILSFHLGKTFRQKAIVIRSTNTNTMETLKKQQ